MSKAKGFGLGLIGCGSFGRFCLDAFGRLDPAIVRPIAAAHVTSRPAAKADSDLPVPVLDSPGKLLARGDVDVVHIATPPASHLRLALMALKAGKHVLCEKPLALTVQQADEMIAAAAKAGLLLAVSFVMRYNPVAEATKAVIDSGVLGRVLSGRLTNCASEAGLGPKHWFWDKSISGGIFIEHGVHFFDLYRYWLGSGGVISAHAERRQETGQEDRVTCTVRHDGGALVSHYHGFDQSPLISRTDHRLACEMGDVRVTGWIPLTLEVDAAVDDLGAAKLAECCSTCDIELLAAYKPEEMRTMGRGQRRLVTKRIRLRYKPRDDKQAAYADDIRSLLKDQLAFIRDRKHVRRVIETDGREALVLAEAAAQMAERSAS